MIVYDTVVGMNAKLYFPGVDVKRIYTLNSNVIPISLIIGLYLKM